ncbi:uncharacterized protein C7orf57-like isoform X2 [Mugil cephalus]|uniref:uncharacterized protein C7orf57-like isoform X2 n=1 Tax=Mugil cephalus TaxID=48193 RepID=UPI001FB7D1E3|nr:uncharacterized protein C7orf57-like isoform X2 [Mugil cephalus]
MNPENSSVLTSDDVSSPKTGGVKTGYQAVDGHISQIPGLSPTIMSLSEDKARGRRAGVLDSDSDYIKLAKQGGHRGLLWHEEESFTSKPSSYKAPNWFCTELGDANTPNLINSEEKQNPGAFQPLEAPFGTDNMSTWERDNSGGNGKEKDDVQGHCDEPEKIQASSPFHTKYRRTVFDKKPAPVDMSKLLSFGYADDNGPVQ